MGISKLLLYAVWTLYLCKVTVTFKLPKVMLTAGNRTHCMLSLIYSYGHEFNSLVNGLGL